MASLGTVWSALQTLTTRVTRDLGGTGLLNESLPLAILNASTADIDRDRLKLPRLLHDIVDDATVRNRGDTTESLGGFERPLRAARQVMES